MSMIDCLKETTLACPDCDAVVGEYHRPGCQMERWHAHIYLSDGRRHYVGEFGFKEEAHEACQVALHRKNPELHPVTLVIDRGVHS